MALSHLDLAVSFKASDVESSRINFVALLMKNQVSLANAKVKGKGIKRRNPKRNYDRFLQ